MKLVLLKNNIPVWLCLVLLAACGSNSTATPIVLQSTNTHTPAASATATLTPTATETVPPTKTPEPTDTATATPTYTSTPSPTLTQTPTATVTPTPVPPTATPEPPQLGLCPVDMSLPGVYLHAGYIPGSHYGIDIAGPHGTPHQSPGHCQVFGLYIDGNGCNGLHLRCSDIDLYQISLGHGDLSYDNYETLHWYGISVETFFNEDGTPKLGVENVRPNQHAWVDPGDDLHFYMGTSGLSGMMHTHVTAFTLVNGEFNGHNDPAEYMDCSE